MSGSPRCRTGWAFAGWSGNADCEDGQVTIALGGIDCEANFVEQGVINVSVTGNGLVSSLPAGIGCPGDCTEVYPVGTQVELFAAAEAGWQFDSWSGAPDCADGVVTIAATPTNCAATFVPTAVTYTLTLTLEGGPGAGEVNSSETPVPILNNCILSDQPTVTCVADFPSDSSVTLVPILYGASTNVVWTGCDVAIGVEGCIVQMDRDRSVTALFE